jgi:hypothetical protein
MKRLLVFLLWVNGGSLTAQTMVFDMNVVGSNFGQMIVTKKVESDSTELYTLNAKGKATILWMHFENETRQEVRYKRGILISSTYVEIENGKTKKWNNINYDGKLYQVNSQSGKRSFAEVPTFSILAMYFQESARRTRIFHEAEADYTTLKHIDDSTLEIKSSDGSRGVYHFEKGKLKAMEFHLTIATVYMKRAA